MTLGIFSNTFSHKTETFVLNHIKHCASTRRVTVICHSHDVRFSPPYAANLDVIAVTPSKSFLGRLTRMPRILTSKRLLSNLKLLRLLNVFRYGRNAANLSLFFAGYHLVDLKVSTLYCHFGQNGKLVAQLIEAGILSCRLVTHFHGLDFTRRVYDGAYYRPLIELRSANVVVTEFSRSCLIRIGFHAETIQTIPVGTNLDFFHGSERMKSPTEDIRILFIGRLIELKGVLLLPDIATALDRTGQGRAQIRIIGDGPLSEKLRSLINHGNLQQKCLLLGRLNEDQIREEMRDAHILVYPGIVDQEGRVENQCVVVQEAMAMMLPVVASDVGGVGESVMHGETGFLCTPGDIGEFATRLSELMADEPLRRTFGARARRLVEEKYDSRVIYKRLEALYTD